MSLFGDLNEVRLMGNMTQDIELRFTPGGAAVANFSIATNRRFKQGDEWKDESEFHNIVVWGNLAQSLAQRAKKGTRVMVIGRLQTRNWDGNDGQKKYRTEIVAEDVFLIDRYERGKMEGSGEAGGNNFSGGFSGGNPAGNFGTPLNNPVPAADAPSATKQTKKTTKKSSSVDPFADTAVNPDDLPF